MQRYQTTFIEMIAEHTGIEAAVLAPLVKTPEPERGDFSLPCFPLAKQLKKNPAAIAQEIAAGLPEHEMFASVEAAGPYLNARIDPRHLIQTAVSEVRAQDESFGTGRQGAGTPVVVEYSSPNIAKPLGFHHLRSTMIGHSLALIHEALGYEVVRINFLGDWGKTFGLLAAAFDRWGSMDDLDAGGISYLLDLYVRANKELENSPEFDEEARAMFRKQEEGDPHAVELWQAFREHSLREFDKVYARLGVSYDYVEGESSYRDKMEGVIEEISRTAGTRVDQGALVVDMGYAENEPPLLLRKSDGATLYATRDLAAATDRWNRFEFAKSLYVVGSEQKRHFDQLKRALSAMGLSWFDCVHHVEFGRIHGMSTRKGQVVFLDSVLDEARDRAREKMLESKDDRGFDIDEVAEMVGVGGIVFGDLKNLRTSDYTFNWEELLNTKGFTGICVQYAHARCCSILRKGAELAQEPIDLSLLAAEEEVALARELIRLPGAIVAAADALEPSRVARAVYEIAKGWNRYQQAGTADPSLRVLTENKQLSATRLALVDATRIALRAGLRLLGVPTPASM